MADFTFAQSRAGFEESGETIENFSEQTAGLTCFDHADKQAIKNARMFGDRFVKSFATLHACDHIADHVPQILLSFRIALFVKRGQRLHERNASFDHGRKLPGEKDEIGFFD